MTYLSKQQPLIYQKELDLIRNDPAVTKQNTAVGIKFWKCVPLEKYVIKSEILRFLSFFGTTYQCEATFHTMKNIRTDLRISDEHLNDFIRIITSSDFNELDFEKLM